MNRDRLLRELRWLAEGNPRYAGTNEEGRQNPAVARLMAEDLLLSYIGEGKSPKSSTRYEEIIRHKIRFCTPRFGITPEYREAGAEGSTSFMAYIHAIAAGHLEFALYAVSLLVSALPEELLLIRMRGFGRRGFGRGFGSFRILRILFVLLFTTLLGPIVLVALIAFAGYAFFNSRRGR